MPKKTAKHRVKMLIEFEFGYHDEVGMTDLNRLATKAELVKELTDDLKQSGLSQFVRECIHTPKTKLKSISFVKFDKEPTMLTRIFKLIKETLNLRRKMAELTANLNDLSPAPAPRNRKERRLLARKGHL